MEGFTGTQSRCDESLARIKARRHSAQQAAAGKKKDEQERQHHEVPPSAAAVAGGEGLMDALRMRPPEPPLGRQKKRQKNQTDLSEKGKREEQEQHQHQREKEEKEQQQRRRREVTRVQSSGPPESESLGWSQVIAPTSSFPPSEEGEGDGDALRPAGLNTAGVFVPCTPHS